MSYNRPQNSKELFNLRHAQARNAIECIFGIVKRQFRILVAAPEYDIQTQAKIVLAICTLHNFIHIHDPDDLEGATDELECRSSRQTREHYGRSITESEKKRGDRIHERNGRRIELVFKGDYIASLSSDKMNAVQSSLSLMARYASAMSMSRRKSFMTLMHSLHVKLPSASTVSIAAAWRTWSEESFSDTNTDIATA